MGPHKLGQQRLALCILGLHAVRTRVLYMRGLEKCCSKEVPRGVFIVLVDDKEVE
jgi:hypothetical protein